MFKDIATIVLAAGRGTRLNSEKPKVLHELAGRPMIFYPLDLLKEIGLKKIVIVVGYGAEEVKSVVGDGYTYALQVEQLGTGHAVACGLNEVGKEFERILVINGDDSAFYKVETIRNLIQQQINNQEKVSFITLEKEDPTGLGRIIRDEKGCLRGIVEEKTATPEQKTIKEVNDGCYVFDRTWLEENLAKIRLSKSGEYYLTDLIKVALDEGVKVGTFKLTDSSQWVGVNTSEQLKAADRLMLEKLKT